MASFYAKYPPKISGGSPPSTLFLDVVGPASAAYSTRLLSSTYSGSCVRVLRDSDNQSMDIGFVNKSLDTASLMTFVGSANGYVTTWYDQSGNGLNLTNAAGTYPLIATKSAILMQNSLPILNFNYLLDPSFGSSLMLAANLLWAFGTSFAIASTTQGTGTIWSGRSGPSTSPGQQSLALPAAIPNTILLNSLVPGFGVDNCLVDNVNTINISSNTLHQVAGYENTATTTPWWDPMGLLVGTSIGLFGGLNGNIGELIFYNTVLAGSLITTANANQKTYWGTP